VIKRLIGLALTLSLIAWFVSSDQGRAFVDVLMRLDSSALLLAAAGFAVSYFLRALRVWDEFRHEAPGRLGACVRIVLMHNAMVNIVPFRGGEAAFPILLGRLFGVPLGRALASLFWFRLQDAFVVVALAIAVWPGLDIVLRVTGIVGLCAAAILLPRWARSTHRWHEHGGLKAKLGKLRDAFAASTEHARFGWLWTIANWIVKLVAQAWLLAHVLGASLDVGAAGALGAELAAILPIQGVAGFGTYEAGAAAAMTAHGVTLEAGLQAALALHLFVIVCACTAGFFAWLVGHFSDNTTSSPPLSGQERK